MGRTILTEAHVRALTTILAPTAGAAPVIPAMPTKGRRAENIDKPDNYTDRLLKYIPAEVVALYLTCTSLVAASKQANNVHLLWIILLVGLVSTPWYLIRTEKVETLTQVGLSTVAFLVWAFALGGPFKSFPWYDDWTVLPALLLTIFTFAVPLIVPKK